MNAKIDIEIVDRVALCNVESRLVATDLEDIANCIENYLEDDGFYDAVYLNLKNLVAIDSIGISWLIQMYKSFAERRKIFKLTHVPDEIMQLLYTLRLNEVISMEPETSKS